MDSEVSALLAALTTAGMEISPSKSKLIFRIKGAAALKYARSKQVKKNGSWHWNFRAGGQTFLIPIEEEVTYLGTILTFGKQADRTVDHRLDEARRRECQLKRSIRSRSVLNSGTRVQIWRSCVVTTALHGLMGLELDARLASRLRQWFHKSLRAVTNMPAHLTKISNDDLCARFGVKEPITALHDLTCNKLRKLHCLPADHISAAPGVLDHWAACERALEVLRRTSNLVSVRMPSGSEGVPCPECGQYFPTIKAARQHAARRHGIKTVTLKDIEYRQEEHSQEGMPQCVHCGKRCGSSDGLRHHILTNACHWHQPDITSARGLMQQTDEATQRPACVTVQDSPNPAICSTVKQGEHTPQPQDHGAATPAEPQAEHDDQVLERGNSPARESDGRTANEVATRPRPAPEPSTFSAAEPDEMVAAMQRTQTGQAVHNSLSVHTTIQTSDDLLSVTDIPRACGDWADRLKQRCSLCNNWAMDKSSVKCHLIRIHAKEWHTHSQEVAKLCVSHKHLFHRDAPCPYCGKPVYGVERHALQCPVLFQVCLLYLLRNSKGLQQAVWHDLRQLDKSTCTSHLQAGEWAFFTQFAQALSSFCLLCAQEGQEERIMDMQQLKRRLRDAHSMQKDSLATLCTQNSANIDMRRPCNFCSQQYQKSPQLRKSKCVPLVQIVALTYGNHGRPGVGRGTGGGSVGAGQPTIHAQSERSQQEQQGGTAPQVPEDDQWQGRQGKRSRKKATGTSGGRRPSMGGTQLVFRAPADQDTGSTSRALPEPARSGQGLRPFLQHQRHEHSDALEGGHQSLAEGIPGEEDHHFAAHGSANQPLAGARSTNDKARGRPGGDEALRGLRTPSSQSHQVVLHGVGPRETTVPAHGRAPADQPGDCGSAEDPQGRGHDRRSDTQVLAASQAHRQSAIQGGGLSARPDHAAYCRESTYRDVEAHKPSSHVTGNGGGGKQRDACAAEGSFRKGSEVSSPNGGRGRQRDACAAEGSFRHTAAWTPIQGQCLYT